MRTTLRTEDLERLDSRLAAVDRSQRSGYPGQSGERQPVHTVYLPADRFHPGIAQEWGATACGLLEEHLPDPARFADALGVDPAVAGEVRARVRRKLEQEPIEDLRVDFEDGYGDRGDTAEDADAETVATGLRRVAQDRRPPFRVGLRCKGLEPAGRRRGLRTMDLVMSDLVDSGGLPTGWTLTLPKVTSAEQDPQILALVRSGQTIAEAVLPRTAPQNVSQLALFGE